MIAALRGGQAGAIVGDRSVLLVLLHQAEEALRVSEDLLRSVTANAPVVLFSVDRQGVYTMVKGKVLEALGREPGDAVGLSIFDVHRDRPDILEDVRRVLGGEALTRTIETAGLTFQTHYEPVRDEDGQVAGLTGVAIDTTERDRAREALRRRTHDLRKRTKELNCLCGLSSLVRRSGIGLQEVLQGTAELVPAGWQYPDVACARIAVGAREFSTQNFRVTRWGQVSDITVGNKGIGKLEVYYLEERPDRDEGPFLKEERDLLNALAECVGRVIEQYREKEELEKHRIHADESVDQRAAGVADLNVELDAFIYSVSHGLRAPLRSIDGFSLALLEGHGDKLEAEAKDYLHRVRGATQRMRGLIDDLLALSRVTRTEVRRGRVDLNALAKAVAADLQRGEPERRVTFEVKRGLTADGDASLLRVVLENLLDNAWKFTRENANPRIEFGVEEQGGELTYFVRDNGVGFDMADVDRLFAPFKRLHPESRFPGSGVGLAAVQRIIRRHGGRAWAEGAVGQGATFYFTLGD